MAYPIRHDIRFILNDTYTSREGVRGHDTLLDYLRLEARLKGTKEGCAEGDCGACTVLVGRLSQGRLVYETVNSCIAPLASFDGCHIITVDSLADSRKPLHTVQRSLVDHHGSQCGFCTPGFVMSLYGLWMTTPQPSREAVIEHLQGNLCRCTGYAPIIRAATSWQINDKDREALAKEHDQITEKLTALRDGHRIETQTKGGETQVIIPASCDDFADLYARYPAGQIIAGATDVGLWITKGQKTFPLVFIISSLEEMKTIHVDDRGVTLGALVTYSEARDSLCRYFPALENLWSRIGGMQIRNRGTIGGNIANGSPIGDTPPALIALGASLQLRRGADRRRINLEDFFIEYGKQALEEGEFIESLFIPHCPHDHLFASYKISKRRDEDISTLSAAFHLAIGEGNEVTSAILAYGGMAGTPMRARLAEAALTGKAFNEDRLSSAIEALRQDFSPLSDWRASAFYRQEVAGNLLRRFYYEHQSTTEGRETDR